MEFNEEMIEDAICKELQIPIEPEFTPVEVLHDKLIDLIRSYHPSSDLELVEKAYQLAYEAHKDQRRFSGEPYIVHPLNVALILAELELDKESIAASLLHDVLEDTSFSYDDLEEKFGQEVVGLVDGVTKLNNINWDMSKVDIQAENLRKIFMAMAKDIRVILVKLADRLHNMRTAKYWSEKTRLEKAKETIEIYSPVASRLGISKIKVELDDRSLAILHPDVFMELVTRIDQYEDIREAFIDDNIKKISARLEQDDIDYEIYGRVKHLFSIYKKMVRQDKTLDQIYDIFAIRVIVDSVTDCYAVLGMIHEMYTPIPGRFKDYIAMPKTNMYQSLHTTVMGSNGLPFEIQIRTFEMHKTAEYGIAAHWKYKEVGSGSLSQDKEEMKLSWLRSIMDWQKNSDNKEFMELVKGDLNLFSGDVYAFTPKGEVKRLPAGSNTIDFAYAIHTAVGNRMVGAKVNGNLVPIDYVIQNGDRIEIMTSQNTKGPSLDWLKMVKSSQARNKINQWFSSQDREVHIARGREMLTAYCKQRGINLAELLLPDFMSAVMKKYQYADWDGILASVGHGALKEGQIINRLLEEKRKEDERNLTDADILRRIEENGKVHVHSKNQKGIVVKGLQDLAVHYSKCCNPIPGDEIVGYITRGRGISIHRTDCTNIMALPEYEKDRLMFAEWSNEAEQDSGRTYETEILIYCNNRIGLFADVTKVMTENNLDIHSVSSKVAKNGTATINMNFAVKNTAEIQQVIGKIRQIPGVKDVVRTSG